MNKAGKPKTPKPYYIKYTTDNIGKNECKITITYFMYNGNVLSDIDVKYEKTLTCLKSKLKETETMLHNRAIKTYNLLLTELKRIGANKTASDAVIKEKMR